MEPRHTGMMPVQQIRSQGRVLERRVKLGLGWGGAEILWCFSHFSSAEGAVALVGRGQPVSALQQRARLEAS